LAYCWDVESALFTDSWPAIAALIGATVYVAVGAVEIGAQQAMVEWGKAGADAKTTLGLYIFISASFPLSFEFGALFLAGIGVALLGGRGPGAGDTPRPAGTRRLAAGAKGWPGSARGRASYSNWDYLDGAVGSWGRV